MGLTLTIPGLLDELEHSKAALAPYLESWKDDREAFFGKAYKVGKGKSMPHNHALVWFSLMRSQLLMGNPRVRWTSDVEGDAQARALALTHACNQISRRTRIRDLNEQLLMDFGFKWAVCLITSAPAPGYEGVNDAPHWPAAYRISPADFRYDPAATRPDARAWSAHRVIASRKALMAQAERGVGHWSVKALEKLETQSVAQFRDQDAKIPERDEVAYWEMWCPGEGDGDRSKGYHGMTYTVAEGQSERVGWLRPPFAAFVPPWGPYQTGGDLVVPDESAPMGPITATAQQADYLNRIKRATQKAVEAYKRLILVRGGGKLPELIKNGKNDWVFSVEDRDLKEAIASLEIGGATDQHFAAGMDAMETLDVTSGITELMKGKVNPNNKATADALASQAAGSRASGPVSKFHDLVVRVFYSIGYLIDRDKAIEIELGPQARGLFLGPDGKPTTRLKGGLAEGQDPEEFFAMDLELQVGSMERDLEADSRMRVMTMQETMQEVAAYGPATALFMDWKGYLAAKAELTGVRELETLVDTDAMQAVAMAMMAQGQAAEAPAGGGPKGQAGPKPVYGGGKPPSPSGMAKKATSPPSGAANAGKRLNAGPTKPAGGSKPKTATASA